MPENTDVHGGLGAVNVLVAVFHVAVCPLARVIVFTGFCT
jgi:hypothetical protein